MKKALTLLLLICSTPGFAQNYRAMYNQPMYQFDTLLYLHIVHLKPGKPFLLPPGSYLYELAPYTLAGGLRYEHGYVINRHQTFYSVSAGSLDGTQKPIKFGDSNWWQIPAKWVQAVKGAEMELYFFTLQPVKPAVTRPAKLGGSSNVKRSVHDHPTSTTR